MEFSQNKSPSRRRILVVDDNHDAATTLAMLFKVSGNETHTAHDGDEAMQKAATLQPDAIILDIGLPKRNGFEVCRAIRQQPWGQAVTMIAVTGWGEDEDRYQALEAGFDGHLVKPIDFQELVKLLGELPSPAEASRSAAAPANLD